MNSQQNKIPDNHTCKYEYTEKCNGIKSCVYCGCVQDVEFEQEYDSKVYYQRPTFHYVDPELAITMKQFDIQEEIQCVINQNKNNPLINILSPYIDDAVKQVAMYRQHFNFKKPTAIQYIVIILSELCQQVPREDIQQLFKCKTLTTALRTIQDIRLSYKSDKLEQTMTSSQRETVDCIKLTVPDVEDTKMVEQLLDTMNTNYIAMDISQQTKMRIAKIIQLYFESHQYKPCQCKMNQCKKDLKSVVVQKCVLTDNNACKLIHVAYKIINDPESYKVLSSCLNVV